LAFVEDVREWDNFEALVASFVACRF